MKPHLPFNAPKKYWDLYERDEIELAPVPNKPLGAPDYALATFELPSYEGNYGTAQNPVPKDLARTLRHGYYACTSYIDAQVGKLLAVLDELDLWDNTIVMFWSDHGFHLGDQGAWGKHMNYEWSTRAPLIVAAPGVQGGARCDALVEYVDMYPTLCDMAGLEKPAYLEGTSMVPLLKDPGREWKSAAFSQYHRGKGLEGYAIRTERYRYVEWLKKENGKPVGQPIGRELYDHQEDPEESVNIAGRPENAALVKRLSEQLATGWKAALPEGL
jgi:arylsulfatase A-like enzyme